MKLLLKINKHDPDKIEAYEIDKFGIAKYMVCIMHRDFLSKEIENPLEQDGETYINITLCED